MNKNPNYFKIYKRLFVQNIKTKLVFKVDFLISSSGIIAANILTFLSLYYIFDIVPTVGSKSYHEMIFIYAFFLVATSWQQIFFDNIWNIWMHFLEGSFIKYCLRPIDSMFYYVSESVDLKGFAQLILGVCLMVYSGIDLNYNWSFGSILLLISLLISASIIYISLMIIAASTGFWIKDPFEVISFVSKVKDFGRYPVTIYNRIIRFVITFILPFGFLAAYPVESVINSPMSSIYTFIVAVLVFTLARRIWIKGLEIYTPTGS